MKHWLAILLLGSLVVLISCATNRPAPQVRSAPQTNPIHSPESSSQRSDLANVPPPAPNNDAILRAEREAAIERKGEFQAHAEAVLTEWNETVGEMKATAKRLGRGARTKLNAKVTQLQNRIAEARNHLNEMRLADVKEFPKFQAQLKADFASFEAAREGSKIAE